MTKSFNCSNGFCGATDCKRCRPRGNWRNTKHNEHDDDTSDEWQDETRMARVGCKQTYNMKTIYKYELKIKETQHIELPCDARILKAAEQYGKLVIWAEVCPENTAAMYEIAIVGTGHDLGRTKDLRYFGTVLMSLGLVWHIFVEPRLIK